MEARLKSDSGGPPVHLERRIMAAKVLGVVGAVSLLGWYVAGNASVPQIASGVLFEIAFWSLVLAGAIAITSRMSISGVRN